MIFTRMGYSDEQLPMFIQLSFRSKDSHICICLYSWNRGQTPNTWQHWYGDLSLMAWPNYRAAALKKSMVHGPCGICMVNGKCTKHFLKPFKPHTTMDQDGYPLYFWPDDGRSYKVHGSMVNNQYIVPYNLLRFDCKSRCQTLWVTRV